MNENEFQGLHHSHIHGLVINPFNTSSHAQTEVKITPINDEISIKKTVIKMHIPEDNVFPWGVISGEPAEIAERYPIIIQIYKDEDPVHFAQIDPRGDGSFEYKFLIRNVDLGSGKATNIFEGDYFIKIFRVIQNNNNKP